MKFGKLLYVFAAFVLGFSTADAAELKLLNVSYDPTREFYQEYNGLFAKHWKEKTGDTVEIQQSHGGGGLQLIRKHREARRRLHRGLPAGSHPLRHRLLPDRRSAAHRGMTVGIPYEDLERPGVP